MRHNNPSFERCLARAATTLHRIVPQTARLRSDPLDLAATLIALSRCEIGFTRHEGALAPTITIHPDPAHSPKAMMLIDQFSTAILETIHSPKTHFSISLEQTVNDSGYLDLVTGGIGQAAQLASVRRSEVRARERRAAARSLLDSARGRALRTTNQRVDNSY